MKDNIFFLKTYLDYHTNGTNRAYWAKFFLTISKELQETKRMKLYSSFDENMPIFEFYSEVKQRFVRIMQYDPQNEIIVSKKYSPNRFYTAWIDERLLLERDGYEPELVVCLLMTKKNIIKAERLIRSWLFETDEKTKELIQSIYIEQEKMDAENK